MAKKKGKEKGKETSLVNVKARLGNVRMLYECGRIKEGLAYMYILYTDLARQKFGVAKAFSQTIRDFSIIMVKQYKQSPQNIYPFIQQLEKVIYGGYAITPEIFQQAVGQFGALYQELTNSTLPKF